MYLDGSQSFSKKDAAIIPSVYRSLHYHHIPMKIHLSGQIYVNAWFTFPGYHPEKLYQFILLSTVGEFTHALAKIKQQTFKQLSVERGKMKFNTRIIQLESIIHKIKYMLIQRFHRYLFEDTIKNRRPFKMRAKDKICRNLICKATLEKL